MNFDQGELSPSGVQIAADFRDNLIIDRYDPVFADMRASKLKHLRSANSEDAVTWNVFRSLRQITPGAWLPSLWQRAFSSTPCPSDHKTVIRLWHSVAPPPGLLSGGDEGISEIDVVIEAATWVWFIEAKYTSDISLRTTTRPHRDQVLRNIDVGSYYAGVRQFFFSLFVCRTTSSRSPHATCTCDRSPRKTRRFTTTAQTLSACSGGLSLRRRWIVRSDMMGSEPALRPWTSPCTM